MSKKLKDYKKIWIARVFYSFLKFFGLSDPNKKMQIFEVKLKTVQNVYDSFLIYDGGIIGNERPDFIL